MSALSEPITATAAPLDAARGGWPRAVAFVWKYFLGAVFCTNALLSVLVVGWTHHAMARVAFRYFWSRSPARRKGLTFEAFIREDEALEPHHGWPNWFFAPRPSRRREHNPSRWQHVRSLPRRLYASTWH